MTRPAHDDRSGHNRADINCRRWSLLPFVARLLSSRQPICEPCRRVQWRRHAERGQVHEFNALGQIRGYHAA